MEDILTAALLQASGLTDLVGDRIHWRKLPQTARLPAVSMFRIAAERDYVQAGRVPTTRWRVQIDAWAETDTEASAVRDQVMAVLDTLRRPPLQAFLNDDPPDGWTPAEPGSDRSTDVYRASLDVSLWHSPPA